jgi:hypothetical protein
MTDGVGPDGLRAHRASLYRYALLQVRDASRADDLVQETLLAALEDGHRFAGREGYGNFRKQMSFPRMALRHHPVIRDREDG